MGNWQGKKGNGAKRFGQEKEGNPMKKIREPPEKSEPNSTAIRSFVSNKHVVFQEDRFIQLGLL
jgi:hypothetical protein